MAARVTARAIRAAVDLGLLIRVRRGCVALPDADPERVAQVAWRGDLTCLTLAERLGLPIMSRDHRIHVAVDAHRSFGQRHARPPDHVVCHYARPSGAATRIAQAIDSASLCVGRVDQLIMVDAALCRGALTLIDLDDFTVTSSGSRSWLRAKADSRAESPIETVARLALCEESLSFVPQAEILGLGRVDFLVEASIVVEMDGRAHHSDLGAFSRDRERDRAAAALGLTVLRFTYEDAVHRPNVISRDVLAALRARTLG